MATRIGIEISPVDCRIVEIEGRGGWGGIDAETRVRSCSVSPSANAETRRHLARLRGREAAVVAWGLRGEHRQALVKAGGYDAMRREAISSLRFAGIDTSGVLSDIAPAGPRIDNGARRPVVTALAARRDVAAALRPLKEAGIRIRSVVTPAAALCSIARMRRKGGLPARVEAYVALEESATCIALVRDCALVAARELPWGYVHAHEPFGERVPRDKVAMSLAQELTEFLASAGIKSESISTVNICGTLPELRTMTAPIMERLEVEIEPLDSMFCVDADDLASEAAEFRERGVELRLAWAAAADWRAPLNLLRDQRRRSSAAVFARAAVVAGVGVGVGAGWMLQQTAWLEASARPPHAARPAPARPELSRGVVNRSVQSDRMPPPKPIGTTAAIPQPPPPIMHEPPMEAVPMQEPPPELMASAEPAMDGPAEELSTRVRPDDRQRARAATPIAVLVAPPIKEESSELGSILFGSDRKLAMIDGRIVEPGDEVKAGTIVEIGPTNVTLRDRRGRLKKLSLGSKSTR